jgi:hypothetical protein
MTDIALLTMFVFGLPCLLIVLAAWLVGKFTGWER